MVITYYITTADITFMNYLSSHTCRCASIEYFDEKQITFKIVL